MIVLATTLAWSPRPADATPSTRCDSLVSPDLPPQAISAAAGRISGPPASLPFAVEIVDFDGASETFGGSGGYQLVALARAPGSRLRVEFRHYDTCGGPELPVSLHSTGRPMLTAGAGTFVLAPPWAVGPTGSSLPSWYEVEDGRLFQVVDTAGASSEPIVFDPTYLPHNCAYGYWGHTHGAGDYLDMYAWNTDFGVCPPIGIFEARHDYHPVYGYEANVANDYGLVTVRQDGSCSWSPDTGYAWDFQVPCKAHDYCYDLRRAGLTGSVSDAGCDSTFFWLMEAHCNDRVFASDCRWVRDTFFLVVSEGPFVANASPPAVSLAALHSFKCADVAGGSILNGAPVVQATCTFDPNQKFRFRPDPSAPEYFLVEPAHAINYGRCVRVLGSTQLEQSTCTQHPTFRVLLNGAFFANVYTLRFQHGGGCWDVPGSSLGDGVQLISYPCFETINQLWLVG